MSPVNQNIQAYIFEEGYTALGGDSHYTTTTLKLLYSPMSDLPQSTGFLIKFKQSAVITDASSGNTVDDLIPNDNL